MFYKKGGTPEQSAALLVNQVKGQGKFGVDRFYMGTGLWPSSTQSHTLSNSHQGSGNDFNQVHGSL